MLRRIAFLFLLAAAMAAPCATAEAGPKTRPGRSSEGPDGYVLEFRARDTENFGHSLVIARRVTSGGKASEVARAGFLPETGRFVLDYLGDVRGQVVAVKADYTSRPTATFTVKVGRRQFEAAVARIAALRARWRTYNAFSRNCNTFVASVASAAGIRAPGHTFALPRDYIADMRALNR